MIPGIGSDHCALYDRKVQGCERLRLISSVHPFTCQGLATLLNTTKVFLYPGTLFKQNHDSPTLELLVSRRQIVSLNFVAPMGTLLA